VEFPKLGTGTVAQYPAQRGVRFQTEVLRFIDGTEQRFPQLKRSVHRWAIRLDLLTEQEVASMQSFFVAAKGRQGSFAFTDPWDGSSYPNCSLEADVMDATWLGEMNGSTSLVVRENV
jgi:hypothetical protein